MANITDIIPTLPQSESSTEHSIGGHLFFKTHKAVAISYILIAGSAALIGTLGNICVLAAIAVNRKLHHARNTFVVNLALADLCVASFADPLSIVGLVEGKSYFEIRPVFCDVIATVCLTACVTALFSIGGLSFNRYLHICHPSIYEKVFSLRNSIVLSVCFWMIGILLSSPALLGWTDNVYDHKLLECMWNRTHSLSFTIFFSTCIVALPVTVIAFSFIKIFLYVRASKKRIALSGGKQNMPHRRNSSIKLARTLFIIFGVFVTCWSPYAILVLIDFEDRFPLEVHLFVVLFAHMHSSLNCIVYAATNVHFRKGYLQIFAILTCGCITVRKSAATSTDSRCTTDSKTMPTSNIIHSISFSKNLS